MRKIEKNRKEKQETITLLENVTIDLGDREVILEKGDRVEVLQELTYELSRNNITVQDIVDEVNGRGIDTYMSITQTKNITKPRWYSGGGSFSFFQASGDSFDIEGLAINNIPISLSVIKFGEYSRTVYLDKGLEGILSRMD